LFSIILELKKNTKMIIKDVENTSSLDKSHATKTSPYLLSFKCNQLIETNEHY